MQLTNLIINLIPNLTDFLIFLPRCKGYYHSHLWDALRAALSYPLDGRRLYTKGTCPTVYSLPNP